MFSDCGWPGVTETVECETMGMGGLLYNSIQLIISPAYCSQKQVCLHHFTYSQPIKGLSDFTGLNQWSVLIWLESKQHWAWLTTSLLKHILPYGWRITCCPWGEHTDFLFLLPPWPGLLFWLPSCLTSQLQHSLGSFLAPFFPSGCILSSGVIWFITWNSV